MFLLLILQTPSGRDLLLTTFQKNVATAPGDNLKKVMNKSNPEYLLETQRVL